MAVGCSSPSLPSRSDAADLVVQGKGTFEELMVCSREIAASTAQLVAASKVGAWHPGGSPAAAGIPYRCSHRALGDAPSPKNAPSPQAAPLAVVWGGPGAPHDHPKLGGLCSPGRA